MVIGKKGEDFLFRGVFGRGVGISPGNKELRGLAPKTHNIFKGDVAAACRQKRTITRPLKWRFCGQPVFLRPRVLESDPSRR